MIPDTWAFRKENVYIIDDLVRKIVSNKNIEGLTILGGEPFDQSEALYTLIKEIRQASNLSIMLFTGYIGEYLEKNNEYYSQILQMIDIFIEGPYIKSQTDFSRQWVGSSNQKIHFLTDKYIQFKDELSERKHQIEIRLSQDGTVTINGMLSEEDLSQIILTR